MASQLSTKVQKPFNGGKNSLFKKQYLTPYTKINSKWISNLSIQAKTIKLLEDKIGVNLYNFGFGNGFLNLISKAQATQEKIDVLFFIKVKNLFIKGHYQESEKTYRMGEYFKIIYLKYSVPGKHKELLQLNNKQTNN